MGRLLLAHLQNTSSIDFDPEDSDADDIKPTIKNTFIHFDLNENNPRQAVFPRIRTAPTPTPKVNKSASTPLVGTAPPAPDEKPTVPDTEKTSGEENPPTVPIAPSTSDCPSSQAATWSVDGRRLKGRDTRLSSMLRPLLRGGPECAELVVTIFPLPASSKRGGACFKAANGVGRIQLKCNNPVDQELSIGVTVGETSKRFQKHNFALNPLMTFHGHWDFTSFIDPSKDRPTVSVSLQLLAPEEAEETPCLAGISDPAIAAFSLGGSVQLPPIPEVPRESGRNSPTIGSSSTPDLTPYSTPREMVQVPWSYSPPQMPSPATPPPSPASFFTIGESELFCFTLRLADGIGLGLEINRDDFDQELLVVRVSPGGAAEAWNRQCFQQAFSHKAVCMCDRIVAINGCCDPSSMIEECNQKQLLKLFVVRGDLPHAKIPCGWYGSGAPSATPTFQFVPVPVPVMPVYQLVPMSMMPCVTHAIVAEAPAAATVNFGDFDAVPAEVIPGASE
jgi:hypothetical protein